MNWTTTLEDQGVKTYTTQVKDRDSKVGAFLEFDPVRGKMVGIKFLQEAQAQTTKSQTLPLPFGVKDNIAIKNFKLTCGSKMLSLFVSPYSATAVEKLLATGAIPVGKTNMDEFGMGSSTDNSALATTHNPWNLERVAGGSSGGSAAAVSAGTVPFALGTDTGGSVRQPANFCGVYGFKPTYGAVSRYGLVAYASSLECIGVTAKNINLTQKVFHIIRGIDQRDHSTLDWTQYLDPKKGKVKTIGVLTGSLGLDPAVANNYAQVQKTLKAQGYELKELTIPMLDYAVPAYYTIATAEASANLARFNGIRYGHRPIYSENPEELVQKSRDEGFGPEVKLRILLGTYVLRSGFQDQFYLRAQKIRTALINDFDKIFESVDSFLMPVFPSQAFGHGDSGLDSFQQKVADKFTTTANLTGLPALAVPTGVTSGLPLGVQFMAPAFAEDRLFNLARSLEKEFPVQNPPDYPDLYDLGEFGLPSSGVESSVKGTATQEAQA